MVQRPARRAGYGGSAIPRLRAADPGIPAGFTKADVVFAAFCGVLDCGSMRIGDFVIHNGRLLVLLGHDPMSVPDRRAQVEDVTTGERLVVPLDELRPCPGDSAG
jgi:hypothetical protein